MLKNFRKFLHMLKKISINFRKIFEKLSKKFKQNFPPVQKDFQNHDRGIALVIKNNSSQSYDVIYIENDPIAAIFTKLIIKGNMGQNLIRSCYRADFHGNFISFLT